jgi:DTW domain-containing protein YfiP
MHPEESKRAIATGRMAHLTLRNSWLFEGVDFTQHREVGEILTDPAHSPLLLYPKRACPELGALPLTERRALFAPGRVPVLVVLDGTWRQARKMHHVSGNLARLPAVQIDPPAPSAFLVRKQPRRICYSTIESIALALELFQLGESSPELLDPFHRMVRTQMEFARLTNRPLTRDASRLRTLA